MSAHADETDDSHAGGRFHPGCAIVPAALATAELADRDGASLLRALALGYDIGARFVMALGLGAAYGRPHSTHSLGGLFGAAAAAGALLGLDARAGALPAVLRRAAGIRPRLLDARSGAHREGVRFRRHAGARRRRRGDHGRRPASPGSRIRSRARAPSSRRSRETPRPEALVEGLGSRFEIMQASIKKWAAGAPIQAALDALETLMRVHGLGADGRRRAHRAPARRPHPPGR